MPVLGANKWLPQPGGPIEKECKKPQIMHIKFDPTLNSKMKQFRKTSKIIKQEQKRQDKKRQKRRNLGLL
tara:strand:+ start:40 stop:249 length:210 start_codon:yes stop_codon:yes gene_type:complete